MIPILAKLIKAASGIVTKKNIADVLPFGTNILDTIRQIKTDPEANLTKIVKVCALGVLSLVVLYLLGKGVITFEQALELLDEVN